MVGSTSDSHSRDLTRQQNESDILLAPLDSLRGSGQPFPVD